MRNWYILNKRNKPISKPVLEAAKWLGNNPEKRIVKQEYIGDIKVSTVFLGLDHGWNSSVPVLWETMIFGGEHDQYQERYTSYEDAVEGHQKAIDLVNSSIKEE